MLFIRTQLSLPGSGRNHGNLKHMDTSLLCAAIVFLILCAICLPAYAAGLTTDFSEVLLENLEPGKNYSTNDIADLPLSIVNTGREPVDLKMELLFPQAEELKPGFEPLPDLSWIKLVRPEFTNINPGMAASTDVLIFIPADAKYEGKKYQVFIWSHTIGKAIGVGLKSKLLFTVRKPEN